MPESIITIRHFTSRLTVTKKRQMEGLSREMQRAFYASLLNAEARVIVGFLAPK